MRRILVIKLGALGDMVLASGAFEAIRSHHQGDHRVLLTTAPYAGFATAGGWFHEVWLDERPPAWRLDLWCSQARRLRAGRFKRVYDLQHATRTHMYYGLMGRPEWSGIAPGCSHPHANRLRDSMHTVEREAEQLAMAGIAATPGPDISWLQADIAGLRPDGRFALLVPGGSAHRPEKRWPADHFAAAAVALAGQGIRSVLIGGAAERDALDTIARACPDAVDLAGRTSFAEIAALGRAAAVAVGNDTGPMHLITLAGCPSVVLFSAASDPVLTAPRGPAVDIVQRSTLTELAVGDVLNHLNPR
ncbi:MAG: glycosyltransferase family 9 protein [Pseudomonadota bacterium]|nr:glycosyltransferase family 9 protein [Pseudomonadota bacterium]